MSSEISATARLVVLLVCWLGWWLPFIIFYPKNRAQPVQRDRRARWGIVTEALGFMIVYSHAPGFWSSPLPLWRAILGIAFAVPAALLSWTAVVHLGRQWRFDAGLNADHELVRSGPYRLVRHPIYASMFCTLLMSIALAGTLPGWPVAIALFIAGTEIRVRIEDGLLSERFGDQFRIWQQAVPAYVPFVR